MKPHTPIAALLLLLIVFVTTATSQTCSCQAPDATCKTSVTCNRGCTAVCASADACYAACGNEELALLKVRVTLKIEKGTSMQIASALTRKASKQIEFTPRKGNESFSVDFKNAALFDALDYLYTRFGGVRYGGVDFEKFHNIRTLMLKGEKLSLNFHNLPVKNVVAKLSFLSGIPFQVISGDAEALLSISLENVTLNEIIERVSAQAGVKISTESKSFSMK